MKPFKSKKHKRKVNYVVMFTTDAVDGKISEIRLTPFKFRLLVVFLCLVIGMLAGFFAYDDSIYRSFNEELKKRKETIASLEDMNQQLTSENEALSEKVSILSETVNKKVQAEKEEEDIVKAMALPTEFPLTGSAQVEETTIGAVREADLVEAGIQIRDFDADETEDDEDARPVSLFTATEGTSAVASGTGTVTEVSDDIDFGYRVVIDHGNGYLSVYLNKAEPVVKEGDSIARGAAVYIIKSENTTFGYQIIENGIYINAMDMIAISG